MIKDSRKTIIHVKKPSDIPTEAHYAILTFGRIQTPGYYYDDPPDYAATLTYTAYLDKADWEDEIKHRMLVKSGESWQALTVNAKPVIKTTVTVDT